VFRKDAEERDSHGCTIENLNLTTIGILPHRTSANVRMRLIDSITPLLVESRLFDDPNTPGSLTRKPEHNKRKRNATHQGVKIGQGGTLDPLADGVLGELVGSVLEEREGRAEAARRVWSGVS
jgi:hypothetical protein